MFVFGEGNPRGMPEHLFFGARRMDYATAEKADISKQNFTVCPRHWYVDAVFVCHSCKEEFIFTKSEQRFWYEEKQFYVDSRPKRCAKCRKAERTRLELRKRYDSTISQALSQSSLETKRDVVSVIDEFEAMGEQLPEGMVENRSLLRAQLAKANPEQTENIS